MEIYNNNINFKYNDGACISLILGEKILTLENLFYKTDKIMCTDKGKNINIIEDLDNKLIQSSENTTNFFMSLIDQFAIYLGCNEIKLIDVSQFKNKTCNFSGYYAMLLASGRSFYGKYGFFKDDIHKYNNLLSTVLLPLRHMNVFTLKQIKYIDRDNTIKSPFYVDDNIKISQAGRRKDILTTIAQMEELCYKLNLKDPVVPINLLYTTLRDYCKNDNNTPLDLSFFLKDHYENFIYIFDFYYFPDNIYHKKYFFYFKHDGGVMSTLNTKTNLFEMSSFIKKDLIITSID